MRVNTGNAPGAGITSASMQFHGTSDRYLPLGATTVATLYSASGTATLNPAVTLRSVGSSGGQAAAFTYDLARSVVYTRQGNPAWAGQERDSVLGVRPERHVLLDLAQHEQDRDPAGRRAAAAPREPDHGHGARPAADAAVLVPPARREGRGRDERRRPLAGQRPRRRHGVRLRAVQAAEPARLRGGELGLRPLDLLHLPGEHPDARPRRPAYVADGFEVALHTSYGGLHSGPAHAGASSRGSSRRSSGSSARGTRACPHRSRIATTASSGWTGRPPPRSSSSRGSGWTRTTTTSRAPGSAPRRGS